MYAIKHEEHIFRKDYIVQLVRLLLVSNEFVRVTQVLKNEIQFLENSEKCKKEGINLYILDLLLVLLITHDLQQVDMLLMAHEFLYQQFGIPTQSRKRNI